MSSLRMRYSTIFSPQILAFSTSVCLQVNKHLCNMLTVAEAMSASMHWNFLAQYSILKEMFADLRSIATTSCKQTAGSPTEHMEEEMEEREEESKGAEKGRSMSTVEGQQMCSWSWRREWRRSRR